MEPADVRTADQARALIAERSPSHVAVGYVDVDGALRAKLLARAKVLKALDSGLNYCNVVLGWDSSDALYDNVTASGWHTGFADAQVRIVPETCRLLALDGDRPLFLVEMTGPEAAVCPRATLGRVLDRAGELGFDVAAAFEYEFFLFDETPDSVREKGYRGLRPLAPGPFGYAALRSGAHAELYAAILELCERMDMPLEGLHEESGPGALEAAIAVGHGIEAADRAALFKTYVKVLAQRRGAMATFMSRWSNDWPGNGGHIHLSLRARDGGAPAFHDAGAPDTMSPVMRAFLAGQQALMPELLAMVAPTVNSYSRLVPGFWAPTNATWGVENRTCALRVIPGSPEAQRIEYRIAGADGNPYLALAAALGSGLWGIEHGLEPGAPTAGNAYEPGAQAGAALPATLVGGRAGAARFGRRARALRRGVRRALRRDARVGGARLPRERHELGARALLRGHLTPRARQPSLDRRDLTRRRQRSVDRRRALRPELAERPEAPREARRDLRTRVGGRASRMRGTRGTDLERRSALDRAHAGALRRLERTEERRAQRAVAEGRVHEHALARLERRTGAASELGVDGRTRLGAVRGRRRPRAGREPQPLLPDTVRGQHGQRAAFRERRRERGLAARGSAADDQRQRRHGAPREARRERQEPGGLGPGPRVLTRAQQRDLRAHQRAVRSEQRNEPGIPGVTPGFAIRLDEEQRRLAPAVGLEVHRQEAQVVGHVDAPQRRVELDAVHDQHAGVLEHDVVAAQVPVTVAHEPGPATLGEVLAAGERRAEQEGAEGADGPLPGLLTRQVAQLVEVAPHRRPDPAGRVGVVHDLRGVMKGGEAHGGGAHEVLGQRAALQQRRHRAVLVETAHHDHPVDRVDGVRVAERHAVAHLPQPPHTEHEIGGQFAVHPQLLLARRPARRRRRVVEEREAHRLLQLVCPVAGQHDPGAVRLALGRERAVGHGERGAQRLVQGHVVVGWAHGFDAGVRGRDGPCRREWLP